MSNRDSWIDCTTYLRYYLIGQVHCRTTPMRNTERALLDRVRGVAEICRQEGVPCLANGDVQNYQDGLRVMEEYHVDGAMIARAAELNPSCFRLEGKLPSIDIAREFLENVCPCHPLVNSRPWKLTTISPIQSIVSLEYWRIEEENQFIRRSYKQRPSKTYVTHCKSKTEAFPAKPLHGGRLHPPPKLREVFPSGLNLI
jgi:tRNA-dihydrouridine synthase